MILQKQFRDRLKEHMEAQGLSQSDLARRMKVSPQFVSQYLRGGACPGLDVVEKFSKALSLENPVELLHSEKFQEVT